MKKILFPILSVLCITGISFCKSPSVVYINPKPLAADSITASMDWDGIYRGILPCGDCDGLLETIYLNRDLTCRVLTKYMGKSDSVYSFNGIITWNQQGNTLTITAVGREPETFLVEQNTLTQLDKMGKKMNTGSASQFILSKGQFGIVEKYWKLMELNGKLVAVDSSFQREPYIIFKDKDYRITGNGGCNNLFGSYTLMGADRIKISKLGSTRMACPQLELETEFLKVLESADSYDLVGDMLVLNRARMAPLARFRIMYMK